MTAPLNTPRRPPLKLAGLIFLLILALVIGFLLLQFRGKLTPKVQLTMMSSRSGLVLDPNSKVTYNGVEIGRVTQILPASSEGRPAAKLLMEVDPKYIKLIPSNVEGDIEASTILGY
jgi:phospholipid/cholesterol/gamma-HCH transport system substrate-binding protein